MKKFIPTYLYVKTHNVTGLKYFGKTTNDPFKYRGSGIYWLKHLKEHGCNVSTHIIGFYTSKEECTNAALQFSLDNNIVNAVDDNNKKIWANQIVENGLDGGATGRTNYKPHTAEFRKKISESKKGTLPWNTGKNGVTPGNKTKRTEKTKQLLREANLGKKHSDESKRKRSLSLKGRVVTKETRQKISIAHKGKKLSADHIKKLKNRIISEETKEKIREARKRQVFTEETKKKLSGKVIVINKFGEIKKINKEEYYTQTGPKENWEFVAHNSVEGRNRKNNK